MNPCGIIATYMDLRKVLKWWFNIPLLVGQLLFMVAGAAYGKMKWEKALPAVRVLSIAGVVNGLFFIWYSTFVSHHYWLLPLWVFSIPYFVTTFRGMDIGRVWRAAQVSHVRLCLRRRIKDVKLPGGMMWPAVDGTFDYMNFGWEFAEIQPWRIDQIDGKRFRYFDPTFPTPPEFMEPVIQYAHDQVGKPYDDLQLISSGLHLIAWIVWPWSWGKELKIIKALNRKDGREHCISGVTACLRWGEREHKYPNLAKEKHHSYITLIRRFTRFFPGYSTATTFPCMIEIDENWEKT